jgi:Fic family protein
VGAGTTCFAHPKVIPNLMSAFCLNLKRDIKIAGDIEHIDPFSLAAKYSMDFVQIHPFRDGSGRMCRIILNAILCRFAGVFCPIGEDDEDIKRYIGIRRREEEALHGHGEYAHFMLEKAYTRVREMNKKLSGKKSR